MIELSRTRDGVKEEGMEGLGEACFMSNGFKEGQEGDDTAGGAGAGKQLDGFPPPPPPPSPHPPPPPLPLSNLMDNISGEFALVINGHSLV